jgi:integrase/recombinase XerD
MIECILEEPLASARHGAAPLLREREQFSSHLLRQGTSHLRVGSIAAYLIHVIRLMELSSLRNVELEEVKNARECWARYRGPQGRRRAKIPARPFSEFANGFIEWIRSRQGLSPVTTKSYSYKAGAFLTWLANRKKQLSSVSLNDVDDFLADKAGLGWQPSTLASQAQALRAFFEHATRRGWCPPGDTRLLATKKAENA